MTKVRQQILKVMQVVHNQWKLNPDGAPFKIAPSKLIEYPDHAAILDKLEKQYEVIKIVQRPDERQFGDADMGMFENEMGKAQLNDYLSYFIQVNSNFPDFYEKHFAENSINVPSLTTKNFFKVMDVAEQIDDKINISPSNKVTLAASTEGGYLHELNEVVSHYQIAEYKQSGLDFLLGQHALKSIDTDVHEETDFGQTYEVVDNFIVEVNRPVFYEVYDELLTMLDKHRGKDKKPEKPVTSKKHHIIFDEKDEKLRNGESSLDISSGTIEFFILKALFALPVGEGANQDDIIEAWGGDEKKQTTYDAVARLNRKFRQLLGTTSKDIKVVYQKSAKLYLNKEYADSISTQP